MFRYLNKKIFLLTAIIAIIFLFIFPSISNARKSVNYWYIKDFQTEIIVNEDSSLLITEKIIADCGIARNKHGIFRILPTRIKESNNDIITPIELISITDFNNIPLKYSVIKNYGDKTITWKIGDPDVTVKGENDYKIVYKVKNVINFDEQELDILKWNLLGNFWDLEIDNFVATVIFPSKVNSGDTSVECFTGELGSKQTNLANYEWVDRNTLQFYSNGTLGEKQGITTHISFPKNIFTPYKLDFFEKHEISLLWFLIPCICFIVSVRAWRKHGRDIKTNKSITPYYEVPEGLSPMEMGMLVSNGSFKNDFITASIIYFAVKKLISIEKIEASNFFEKDDYVLEKNEGKDSEINNLSSTEGLLFQNLFDNNNKVKLSSLKKSFYLKIPFIKKAAINNLIFNGLIFKKSLKLQKIFIGIGFILILSSLIFIFSVSSTPNPYSIISLLISFFIIVIFSIFMPKRTKKGSELLWKIKGYKLYMETAEKHRQEFYEEKNIFEKHLPYAMAFGITKQWIKKIEKMYGEEYFKTYHPVWFKGTNISSFSTSSFISELDNLSSGISSGTGGGAGGGAGSGGGGGGGGGW